MRQDKEYFAFISYQREDEEWAKWLAHELEHYHLPITLNGRDDLPKELRPIFRDIDELSAGNLPQQIHQALENSKNLVVVCSPRSAQSPWVNKEVEEFISMGKTDKIFRSSSREMLCARIPMTHKSVSLLHFVIFPKLMNG